jgi:hypothetical protein
MATEQHRRALLESFVSNSTAKLAFANAIVIAQRAGMTDLEIAQTCGYTVPMIHALLRTP